MTNERKQRGFWGHLGHWTATAAFLLAVALLYVFVLSRGDLPL